MKRLAFGTIALALALAPLSLAQEAGGGPPQGETSVEPILQEMRGLRERIRGLEEVRRLRELREKLHALRQAAPQSRGEGEEGPRARREGRGPLRLRALRLRILKGMHGRMGEFRERALERLRRLPPEARDRLKQRAQELRGRFRERGIPGGPGRPPGPPRRFPV